LGSGMRVANLLSGLCQSAVLETPAPELIQSKILVVQEALATLATFATLATLRLALQLLLAKQRFIVVCVYVCLSVCVCVCVCVCVYAALHTSYSHPRTPATTAGMGRSTGRTQRDQSVMFVLSAPRAPSS
jgi:fluoride ion exporter CrcB/FEX